MPLRSCPRTPTPTHPHDGFSTLRFRIGLFVPIDSDDSDGDGDDDDDNDDSSDFAIQSVELCFHESFIPSADPVSLHFAGAGSNLSIIHHDPPPALPTPTPPGFIVECHGLVRLVPPTSTSTSPLALLSPAPISVSSKLPRCCLAGLLSSAAVAVAVAVAGWIIVLFLKAPCPPPLDNEICANANSSYFHANPAIHNATVLPFSTDILAVVEAWARIPHRLATLDRLKSSNNDPDAALRVGRDRDVALRDTRTVARAVFRAVISLPSCHDPSSLDIARFQYSSVIASISDVVLSWRDMDDDIKVSWSRPIARDASELYRVLRAISITDEDAPFFFRKGSNTSLTHRLLPIINGKLHVRVSPAAMRVLDVYVDSFAESITESRECAFFRACTQPPPPPDRLHPVCQMPPLLPLNHSVAFFEDWDRSRRQSLANHTQTATINHDLLDEPPLVAVARHLTALASRVDDLIAMADTSLGAKNIKGPNKRGIGDWARGYLQRLQLVEDESDQDRFAAAAAAAKHLHALRMSSIYHQEISAVTALVAVRDTCSRLEQLRETISHLRIGEGWVRIAIETETRVTHAQLPQPDSLAKDAEALAARVEEDGRWLTEGLYRLMAEQSDLWWVGDAEDSEAKV